MKQKSFKKGFNAVLWSIMIFIIMLMALIGCGQKKGEEIVLGKMTIAAGDHERINTVIRYQCLPGDIFGDPAKFRREGFSIILEL